MDLKKKGEFAMKSIEQQLRDTWSRERRLCHIRGFSRSLIWVLMLLFLGLIIDYGLLFKTHMPAGVTLLLTLAGFATMVWVIWKDWINKLQPFNATRIAIEVESKNPELMSSLVSYTEFESMSKDSTASPELLKAMREFAVQKSSQLTFSDIIDFGQIKKLLSYAVVVLIISAGLSVRWSDHFGVMFKRMAGIETSYPIQTKLLDITGDIVVPFGKSVDIKVSATGVIPDLAVLYVRPATALSGDWSEMPMENLDNGFSFIRTIETPEREMVYYISMGDYNSKEYNISVVRAPRVIKTELTLNLPTYLKRKNQTSDQLNIEVPEGTVIKWNLSCDKKVGQLTVNYRDKKIKALVAKNETDLSFTIKAEKSFAYTFEWTEGASGKGFHFEDVEYNVKVIRDAKPRIAFVGRAPNGPATLSKSVDFNWRAKDDYGLDKLWLVYTVTTPGSPETPEAKRLLVQAHKGLILDDDHYSWHLAKSISGLKAGQQISYHLEVNDLKEDKKSERITSTPMRQITIFSKEDYLTWFRRELKSRNDLVKQTFVAERSASKQLKILLLDKEASTLSEQLKSLESTQGNEARKMGKVSGDLAWLVEELNSNNLSKEGGSEKLKTYGEVLAEIANSSLPTVTLNLRNARLEKDASSHYITSAKEDIDTIVEELKKVLSSSLNLLIEEALIVELKDIIKVESEIREKTVKWGIALLMNPESANAGKGPLMQKQNIMLLRFENFLKMLVLAKKDALDEDAINRFEQAEQTLNPKPPTSENKVVQQLLEAEPTVKEILQAAVEQIENADVLSAVAAQDRTIAAFKMALQILSSGQFELGEFVAGLEKLIEKQKELRKEVKAEEKLEKKSAFFEARQMEIQDEVTDYTFNAPDLFVSAAGEFLVEPLMIVFSEATEALQASQKAESLDAQANIIILLESVYGTALAVAEEKEEGDPFWAYSPEVPEDKWKLPEDGDEEDEMEKDEDFPEIFEGIFSAELMIQSDNAAKGAQADVSTAMAANRMLNFDEGDEDDDPPDYITDEGPPSVGGKKDAASDAGGKGEGNTDAVEKERLAKDSMKRRRQRAKVQNYVRQLPPEFRRQVADYYEVIAE
jgi:hypothetical protein